MTEQREFVRMTLSQRIQHILILSSFIVLSISGFALHFPHARWSQIVVSALGGPHGRAMTHRVAALVMVVTILYHLCTIVVSAVRHRRMLREQGLGSIPLMFSMKDLLDIRDSLAYFLHIEDKPPKYDKYNYTEKVEYWSLLWGAIVMTVSGLVLWFPFRALMFLPRWAINASLVIHGYEASLAVLSIVVWHWYNVHLSPDHFPMSWTWINGKISEEDMKLHHPLEYERLTGQSADSEG